MVTKGLLARYVPDVPTAKLVTSEAAKRALGADVDGYVMPMFNSQTAIAYNTEMVKAPPSTYAELDRWVRSSQSMNFGLYRWRLAASKTEMRPTPV